MISAIAVLGTKRQTAGSSLAIDHRLADRYADVDRRQQA